MSSFADSHTTEAPATDASCNSLCPASCVTCLTNGAAGTKKSATRATDCTATHSTSVAARSWI
eukprot:5886435-Alexandrium_andersonii.AAC.1